MFTGIVKGVGSILESAQTGSDRRMRIDTHGLDLGALKIGASVAVNGVCLTAVVSDLGSFTADVSQMTLAVTTLGSLTPGGHVNIETALSVGDALDGHWVMGHVDGVGTVVDIRSAGRSTIYRVSLPDQLSRYVVPKGSIAVDGVSLTVNAVAGVEFEVNVIPHTRAVTIIGEYAIGVPVNIEVDIVARYLERLTVSAELEP